MIAKSFCTGKTTVIVIIAFFRQNFNLCNVNFRRIGYPIFASFYSICSYFVYK